jgi:uncharacterized membrane protein
VLRTRLERGLDRLTQRLGELGVGAFAWPFAIGIGLGTGILGLAVPRFAHGLLKHRASDEFLRQSLEAIGISTLVVAAACALLAFLRARRGDVRPFPTLYNLNLRRVAFLTALPLVVAIGEPIEVSHSWLVLAFAATASVLATYSAYQWMDGTDADESLRGARRYVAPVLVGLLATGYAVAIGYLSVVNHLGFNTGRSDLGYYMTIFRESSQGKPLGCSLCGYGSHLSGHFDPILVLLSPLYLIYPWSETLLVIQTVWLASGAVPVYLLARHHVKNRWASVAFAATYLTYPALHGANLFDFHSLSLAGPLFLWLLYFLDTGNKRAYFITLPFLLLVREDISIALSLIGIHCLFSKSPERARLGLVTILVSCAYFVIAKAVFMGHIDPLNAASGIGGAKGYSLNYEDMIPPGRSTGGLIGTVFGDPTYSLTRVLTEEKLDFIAKLGVPLLFLPLLGRGRIVLAYGAALTLLAMMPFLHSIHFQYTTVLTPFLFVLALSALGRVGSGELRLSNVAPKRLRNALVLGILVSTLLCSWKFGALLPNGSFHSGFRPLVRTTNQASLELDAWLRGFARSLPRGAKVAANTRLIPHLGKVSIVYMIDQKRDADYVIAGMANRDIARLVTPDIKSGELVQIAEKAGVKIFKTKYKPLPVKKGAPALPIVPIEKD